TIEPATDLMVQRFSVSDGLAPAIGNVRNINVPGDEDGATNGQMRVEVDFPGLNSTLDRIAGTYLYRLVDPNGVFPSVVQPLTVLQKVYPQGVSGTVIGSNGQILSNSVV